MIVSRADVLAANGPFISNYVPSVDPLDTPQTVAAKVGSRIQVTPDGTDSAAVTIRFVTGLVIAVSDGEPDFDVIRKVLNSLVPTAVGAATAGAATAGTVLNGVPILGDISAAANRLYQTSRRTPTLQFIVPVQITKDGCTYSVLNRFMGSSVTTDWDADEYANIETDYRWLRTVSTPRAKHENQGTEKADDYSISNELAGLSAPVGRIDTAATAQIRVSTDGATFHDTISALRVDVVEVVITESCPASTPGTVTPPPSGVTPPPGGVTPPPPGEAEPGTPAPPSEGEAPPPEGDAPAPAPPAEPPIGPISFPGAFVYSLARIDEIDSRHAERLASAGIADLRSLAAVDPARFELAGINPARLRRWRALAEAMLRFPSIDSADARRLTGV